MPAIAEDRPPYVVFEVQAEEDRDASIAAGHYVAKDVVYAIVTPQGSKDRIPRQVDEWFANLTQQVKENRFPAQWLQHFQASYTAWKEGNEMPLHGTPIVAWPVLSPAQVKSLLAGHIKTVEDLAAANEEALSRAGLGSRALKQRAIDWLASARDTGKLSEEMASLRTKNKDLEQTNIDLRAQLQQLAAKVETLSAKA